MKINVYLHKLVEDFFSVKFTVFVVGCVFLVFNKITSDNWVAIALSIAGMHTAAAMTGTFMRVPPIIPRCPDKGIDNPDSN